MLHIQIIQVGKTKESFIKEAVDEYIKRIRGDCKLEIITIKEKKGERTKVIKQEGEEILKKLSDSSYFVVALDVKGNEKSSEKFAEFIEKMKQKGNLCFLIGGAYGLSPDVLTRADETMSLSKMTFTHQMVRMILLEQLYRAFSILENKSYHH